MLQLPYMDVRAKSAYLRDESQVPSVSISMDVVHDVRVVRPQPRGGRDVQVVERVRHVVAEQRPCGIHSGNAVLSNVIIS